MSTKLGSEGKSMVREPLRPSTLPPSRTAEMIRGHSALTPALCRAARGALEWTQEQLALRSGVSRSTIKDFEGRKHSIHRSTASQIVLAFEAEGLTVISAPGVGFGLWKLDGEEYDNGPDATERVPFLPKEGGLTVSVR